MNRYKKRIAFVLGIFFFLVLLHQLILIYTYKGNLIICISNQSKYQDKIELIVNEKIIFSDSINPGLVHDRKMLSKYEFMGSNHLMVKSKKTNIVNETNINLYLVRFIYIEVFDDLESESNPVRKFSISKGLTPFFVQ